MSLPSFRPHEQPRHQCHETGTNGSPFQNAKFIKMTGAVSLKLLFAGDERATMSVSADTASISTTVVAVHPERNLSMSMILSDDDYRTTRRAEWHEAGKGYLTLMGRGGPLEDLARLAAEQVFKLADLRPGDSVLDVGTGAGSPALEAWPYVGSSGRIVGIDFAPSMVEAARAVAVQRGVENAEFYEMEGEKLGFPENSFDAIISRYAYPHFTSAARAFEESLRVLRPGGRLAAAMHGDTEHNPYLAAPVEAMARFHIAPRPLTERGPFGLASPGALEALLRQAGFSDVRVYAHDTSIVVPDFDKYWEAQKKGGAAVRRALEAVPPQHRAEAEAAALAAMSSYVTGNKGMFPARINLGFGIKPR